MASKVSLLVAVLVGFACAFGHPDWSDATPRSFDLLRHRLGLGRVSGEPHRRSTGQEANPYVFESESFQRWVESEAGEISGLSNFRGALKTLEDYEVGFLSLETSALLLPLYLDADLILDVFQGHGRISVVQGNELHEWDLGYGDFLGIPAGSVVYVSNIDPVQRLRVYVLLHTAPSSSSRGHAPQAYYIGGGQNPSTVYSGFTWSTLQAAFKSNKEQLESVLEHQSRGPIVYMKKEQMQKLNNDHSARPWRSSTEDEENLKPFSIMQKEPDFSNDNGWLIEAGGQHYSAFEWLDIAVSLWRLTAGSLVSPHWNSEATKVGFVLEGEGTLEVSSPTNGTSYANVQGRLKPGDVFIVPAGLPSSQIASPNGPFEFVIYEVHARHNRRHFLAGSNSILKQIPQEILEVSYGAAWKEISPLLDAQPDQVFLRASVAAVARDTARD